MFDSFVALPNSWLDVVQFLNMITINILKFASSQEGKQEFVWAENYLDLV